jgi:hypothetical protein
MESTTKRTAGRRFALVVATGSYADPTLAKLRAPGRDASELAAVLGDPAIGGFEVEVVHDAPAESLRRAVAQFCTRIGPRDLVLVYLSCHGVLDDRGRLYYATVDTDRELLSATAVPSAWLNEQLEDCRSRRQILVLDCCHSGAFAKGAKGEGSLALRERFEGRGRVVLTGSRGTEYSFERDQIVGDEVSSVFTTALVEGLRSGEADRDGDGVITVSELYDHAYEVVRAREGRQTPTLWTYGAEGDLLVAHSPRGAIVKPAPLPEDLVMLLESARSRVRESAVTELADLLTGSDPGRALTARAELERVAAEDVPGVAAAARGVLDANPGSSGPRPPRPAEPPPPPPRADPPAPASPPPARRRRGAAVPPVRRRRVAIAGGAIALIAVVLAIVLLAGGEEGNSAPGRFAPGEIAVPGHPQGIAVDDEGTAWVARYEDGEVTRIDPSSTPEPIPVKPHPTKIAAGEGSVWVSVRKGRELQRIEPGTAKPKVVEDPITKLAIAQGKLWVSSEDGQSITKHDLDTGQLEEAFHLGKRFEGVFAVGDDAVWAVERDGQKPPGSNLIRIDIESGVSESTPIDDASPFVNGIAYGKGTVWIADASEKRNQVTAFNSDSKPIDKFKVKNGIADDDIAVIHGGVLVWEPVNGRLTPIELGGPPEPKGERVRGYPEERESNVELSDLAVDGDFAWVTDPKGNKVYKVKY